MFRIGDKLNDGRKNNYILCAELPNNITQDSNDSQWFTTSSEASVPLNGSDFSLLEILHNNKLRTQVGIAFDPITQPNQVARYINDIR